VTVQAEGIVSFQVRKSDCLIVLVGPFKQPAIPNRLALHAVALVLGIDGLAKVLGVGEVEGDVVGVEPASEASDHRLERPHHLLEVGADGDQVGPPVELLLILGAGPIGVEVGVDP